MKHLFAALLISSSLFSCKNHSANNEPTAGDSAAAMTADSSSSMAADTATQAFFPVTDFIGGQIKMVDSLQMPISKSITINHKTTLAPPMNDAEFKTLAAAFLQPDISDPSLKKFYKESSYADQSIPSIVLSYTTTDPALEIKKIDVIITPDPIKSDKVRTIYMEKQRVAGDTIIRQKLYWKANRNFQVITEKQVGKTLLPAEQVKVVWDPTP